MIVGKKRIGSELLDYKCGFCKFEFQQYIRSVSSTMGKRCTVTDQVRCPKYKNGLKTYQKYKK